jgi:hypothetical protein
MYLRKQSVVCLVVAAVCSLLLAAYMAAPTNENPYDTPTIASYVGNHVPAYMATPYTTATR